MRWRARDGSLGLVVFVITFSPYVVFNAARHTPEPKRKKISQVQKRTEKTEEKKRERKKKKPT